MANCNYKVNIKDIQSKYSFKIFCSSDNAEIQAEIGNLEDLTTTAKNNLVSAINEVHSDTETNATAISGLQSSKEDKSNKVTSISSASTDTQYPSAKAVYDSQETQDETISTLETNLEETQNELDYYKTIYNVLPKVSGNGESLTLNDTGESILKLDPRGQCKQDSTTGRNLVGYNNSLPYTDYNMSITRSGEIYSVVTSAPTSAYPFASIYTIPAGTLNGTYLLKKIQTSGTSSIGVRIIDRTVNPAEIITNSMGEETFSITSQHNDLQVEIAGGYNREYNEKFEILLQLASITDTSYEPYTGGQPSPSPDFPQQIHEVSGDNEIKAEGKNLSPINEAIVTGTTSSVGTIGSINGTILVKNIPIKSNTKYYISLNKPSQIAQIVAWLYNGKLSATSQNSAYTELYVGGRGVSQNATSSGNTNTDYEYMAVSLGNDSSYPASTSITIEANEIMIREEGTTDEYEPYNVDTYELDLPVENLLDKDSITVGLLNADGTVSSGSFDITDFIPIQPNTKYTINNATGSHRGKYYNTSKQAITNDFDFNFNTDKTITTPNNAYYMRFAFTNTLEDILQLEKGSKANSYSPFGQTPIKMRGIGTYEDYFVRNSGKNLFDGTYYKTYTAGSSPYNYSTSDSSRSGIVKVEPNTTYTISKQLSSRFRVSQYTSLPVTGTSQATSFVIPNGSDSTLEYTFTTSSDTNYLAIQVSNTSEENVRMQVEKGSQATIYEPFGKDMWCKYNAIGEVVLDGSENWSSTSSYANYYRISLSINDIISTSANDFNLYSNYFLASYGALTTTQAFVGAMAHYRSTNDVYFVINENSTENFKTWLGAHNTLLYYQLASPYLSLIENETLISQLDKVEKALAKSGQTNISQVNNDIPFKIYASALKEIE